MLDKVWDCVVIGAGPAGSAAAIRIAGGGADVLLIDKSDFPREKVCGDGLIEDSQACLKELGLYDEVREQGHVAVGMTVYGPSRGSFDIDTEFITLKRVKLDYLVRQEAISKGAIFLKGAVQAVVQEGDEVVIRTATDRIRAKYCVIAAGATRVFDDWEFRKGCGVGLGMRCYIRSSFLIEKLIVTTDRTIAPGYSWIFPLGNGEYNIGCGVFDQGQASLRDLFGVFVSEFPLAKSLMADCISLSPLIGSPLCCGMDSSSPVRGRVVAAGEAIGSTFPFSGEGIGKALKTGMLAGDSILVGLSCDDPARLVEYRRQVEQLRALYRGYKIAQRWSNNPLLVDFVVWRISRSPYLSWAMAGVMAETVDPTEIFSFSTLIKSFVS